MLRKKILDTAKKFMPPISQTEKEALQSGTVGWDAELMKGTPDWSKLFNLPKPQLTAEEQAFLDGPVEKLCAMLNNWQIQKDQDLPKEAWDFIKAEGFMGMEIPKEYGGLGFSSAAHSAVVMKLASRSTTAAVTVMVPNSLGPAELIHSYGTDDQKKHYLPRLARGLEVPCFALTGPDAGSDAGSLPDTGVVCKNDKGELGIRLNWEKRYITLGPVSTLIGLAFRLKDPDNLLGKNKEDVGITCALVPSNLPGIEIGDRHRPMDIPFFNGPNKGKDVFIPIDNIIGGPEKAGQGWRMLMESLGVGRSLSLPALSTAAGKLCCFATGSYARVRKQFNSPIAKFEGVEEPLGKMAGLTYMMNAAREATLQMVDNGERPVIPSAMLKYHHTENMRTIINDTMDIHGGKGVCDGPRNLFADLYKAVPIGITVEGANIMTRNLIIFGQGAVRAHPYILRELKAVENPDPKQGFKDLIKTVAAHGLNATRSFVKSVVYGVTGGMFSKVPVKDRDTKKYYKQINRLSAAFSLATEATVGTLGGNLKMRERVSARMGDVYSYMYLASTVLWQYEKNGRQKDELPLVHWAATTALHKAEEALSEALRNHPIKAVGLGLRPLVFPLGKRISAPTDKMDAAAANTIRDPGAVRDRLTAGIFKPANENEQLGLLETAFKKCVEVEPLEKKLYKAQKAKTVPKDLPRADVLDAAEKAGVLTAAEVESLKTSDRLRREVITVDAFPQQKPVPAAAPAA
jgi:acyl-CoA dehydrogenase